MTANVRDASIDDAAGIAKVRVQTWRAAYRGLVPQEVLDRLSVERETILRIERWDEHHADAAAHDLVAVADSEVVGWAFANGHLPLSDALLCVSGRISFELVQKAAVAGCPILAAVGAPSSLAVELAADRGVTVCGFVRGGRLNVYTEPWRIAG